MLKKREAKNDKNQIHDTCDITKTLKPRIGRSAAHAEVFGNTANGCARGGTSLKPQSLKFVDTLVQA
jgi:hypothetical protein